VARKSCKRTSQQAAPTAISGNRHWQYGRKKDRRYNLHDLLLLALSATSGFSEAVIQRQPTWKIFALARADVTKSGFLWEFNEIFWH